MGLVLANVAAEMLVAWLEEVGVERNSSEKIIHNGTYMYKGRLNNVQQENSLLKIRNKTALLTEDW